MKLILTYHQGTGKPVFMADVISGMVLLLFLYTSLSKLADYETFRNVLLAIPLLRSVAGLIAWLLPASELVIVVLLFIPRLREKGLMVAMILITLFTIYLLYMVAFIPNLPCSCGGVIKLLTWRQHIVFNLFFIFLSLIGIALYHRAKNLKSSSPP